MKKFIKLLVIIALMSTSLLAQKVSNYSYKLDNGITVKTEQGWNQVWVDQRFDALGASDQAPLALSVRTLGELATNSTFKLFSGGKEVKTQGAKPGSYTMKVSARLTGKPGTLSFDIENIEVRAKNKTTVNVTLYDYQIIIDETTGSLKGLASYNSKVDRFKGVAEQSPACGTAAFYPRGTRDKPLQPDEVTNPKSGRIKPGTYDVLITLGASGRTQKIWLENFNLKPDFSYNILTNLNAGIIEYAGGNKDVKSIHLYPAGLADRQKGAATPDKNSELIRCEGLGVSSPCPPGTYDVLLNYNNGAKYEWRKGIAVSTGKRVQVK